MIAISNSSPLIALSRVDHLHVLKQLFGKVYIPDDVFEETVLNSKIAIQKTNLLKAINEFIETVTPQMNHHFQETLVKEKREF